MEVEKLIEALRVCYGRNGDRPCNECPYFVDNMYFGSQCIDNLLVDAADALEKMKKEV